MLTSIKNAYAIIFFFGNIHKSEIINKLPINTGLDYCNVIPFLDLFGGQRNMRYVPIPTYSKIKIYRVTLIFIV